MRRGFGSLWVAGLVLAGCGGRAEENNGNGNSSNTVNAVSSRRENDRCPTPRRTGRAAGEACKAAEDCAEVCCDCANGKSFGAQACLNNTCVTDTASACPAVQKDNSLLCK